MTACPSCHDEEAVQPVSVAYAEASAERPSSDLAWLLAPPRIEPRLPAASYRDHAENMILLPATIFFVVLGIVVAIVGFGFVGLLVVTLPGTVVGLVVAKVFASTRYEMAKALALATAAQEERAPAHVARVEQWQAASFCPKDEIIFFEGDDSPLTPVEFQQLMSGTRPPVPAPAKPIGTEETAAS